MAGVKKKFRYKGWVLQYQDGTLEPETFGETKDGCWMLAFPLIKHTYKGETMGKPWVSFQDHYWKRWNASLRAAKKLGYDIVAVHLTRDNATDS